jgi:hypothetical protein
LAEGRSVGFPADGDHVVGPTGGTVAVGDRPGGRPLLSTWFGGVEQPSLPLPGEHDDYIRERMRERFGDSA